MAAKKLAPYTMKFKANTGTMTIDADGGIIACVKMIADFMPAEKQKLLIQHLQAQLDQRMAKEAEQAGVANDSQPGSPEEPE